MANNNYILTPKCIHIYIYGSPIVRNDVYYANGISRKRIERTVESKYECYRSLIIFEKYKTYIIVLERLIFDGLFFGTHI